jgi:hypothetical protein
MRVHIGPYIEWFGPYQLADLLQRVGVSEDRCFKLGQWLDQLPGVNRFFEWVHHTFRQRRVSIKIHPYDVWNIDDTLALIILPMLKMFREKKHGYPTVDDEDVPPELRSTAASALTEMQISNGDTDNNWNARWEWVLNEMVWAFEQMDPEADDKFFGVDEIFDDVGYRAWQKRKQRGLTLFGKYFEALWD